MSERLSMEEEIMRGYILNWIKAGGYRKIPVYLPEARDMGLPNYCVWLADAMSHEIFDAMRSGEILLVEPAADMEAIGEAMIHMGLHLVEARREFDAATRGMPRTMTQGPFIREIHEPGIHDAMLDATEEEKEQIAIGSAMLNGLETPPSGGRVGDIREFYILEWERRTGKKWPRESR